MEIEIEAEETTVKLFSERLTDILDDGTPGLFTSVIIYSESNGILDDITTSTDMFCKDGDVRVVEYKSFIGDVKEPEVSDEALTINDGSIPFTISTRTEGRSIYQF